jgi:hypothetical protein
MQLELKYLVSFHNLALYAEWVVCARPELGLNQLYQDR